MKRKKRGTVDVRQIAPADITRPLTGFRTRQEYRTLTVAQRNRLHAALNEVYQDGTMTCFALVHRNALIDGGAHGGGAFLPWHRVFLALFEEALRQKDPSVSLPYWDSTLDDNMAAGPGFSVMWDNAHLGPGTGTVDAGPFAGWNTAEGPLQRAVARGNGNLVRQDRINTLLNSCLLDEFTDPWESTHDSVHVWVGGTMERSFAASDPVFYMHHAFVDYIWERFRQRQRTACGVDPATDYPPDRPDSPDHSGANPMVGMDFLRNRDGIADYWINNWFNYTDSPTCANNCGNSEDLYCDTAINRCVSDSRFDFGNPVSTTPMPGSTTSMAGSTTSMPGFTTSTPQTATSTTRTTPSTTRSSTPTSQTTTRLTTTTTTSRTTTTTTPISTPTTRTATVTPRTQALTSRTTTSMWTDSTLSSLSSSLTDLIPPPLDDNHTDRRPRSSDQGFYSQKVKDGQKPYEGKCSNDPYETSCAKRPMPATPDEVVNAISRNELPMSPSMKAVYDAIAKELKRSERFPPESEQQWFHMRPDEENDCRCLNKFIRDPLEAYVKDGRQLNRYGPKISQSP
ncbi:putative tyrosinase-like protein tyr-3 [Dreissena polymorpha]|uniref:putative tyrosinase-like protein tyr-3 n=1 Tax=Dreissena polymorpha TaxID=45954 RepID=UPI0022645514|nr:putative tyrosinase-like protein tyr-3 [Dreissena polymorpha]